MGSNQVRIIAGRWRGRKLSFPATSGLRPTPDRIRETLFNWLMPRLSGAVCLDLFAGSGALGFEAASRGAARVVMVERDAATNRLLRDSSTRLDALQVELMPQEAAGFLAGPVEAFDLVFLDPPFDDPELLAHSIHLLTQRAWLKPGAAVYVETPAKRPAPSVPESWLEQKHKTAGQVEYRLFRCQVSP